MNAKLLLDNFDRISGTSDSGPRLRQFVLDLAVRGKLTEQNREDEPAVELIKRIQLEKLRLLKTGQISKVEPVIDLRDAETPFRLPSGWAWSRLSALSTRIHYGFTASANVSLKDVRLLRITDIQDNAVDWATVPGCEISEKETSQYELHSGDILIARTGGTIGKTFLVRETPVRAVFASYLIRVRRAPELNERYLKLFLESSVYWKQLQDGTRGGGQPNVNGQTLGRMAVAVPPLAEQQRIVSTVEKMMTLCDQLETRLRQYDELSRRFASSALHWTLET